MLWPGSCYGLAPSTRDRIAIQSNHLDGGDSEDPYGTFHTCARSIETPSVGRSPNAMIHAPSRGFGGRNRDVNRRSDRDREPLITLVAATPGRPRDDAELVDFPDAYSCARSERSTSYPECANVALRRSIAPNGALDVPQRRSMLEVTQHAQCQGVVHALRTSIAKLIQSRTHCGCECPLMHSDTVPYRADHGRQMRQDRPAEFVQSEPIGTAMSGRFGTHREQAANASRHAQPQERSRLLGALATTVAGSTMSLAALASVASANH